jgi:hypothetical protein
MITRVPVRAAMLSLFGFLALAPALPASAAEPTGAAAQAAPTVTPLPVVRKLVPVQRVVPGAANIDLRPDLVARLQTEPPVPNFGTYNPYSNQGKPLQVTAVIENAGLAKAEKVAIDFSFSKPPLPFQQSSWKYQYTVDLAPGESVSYPVSVLFFSTTVTFAVKAGFAGDEKSTTNNAATLLVKFH